MYTVIVNKTSIAEVDGISIKSPTMHLFEFGDTY